MKLELSDAQAKEICLTYVKSRLHDLNFCQDIVYLVLGRQCHEPRGFYFRHILISVLPKLAKDHCLNKQNMKDEFKDLI